MEDDKSLQTVQNKKKTVITVLCIITVISALLYYLNSLRYETTDDAYIERDVIRTAPRVSGQIKEVYIKDNQRINEGDLIAEIDDAEYKIKYEQAKAAYEKALYSQKIAKSKLEAVNSELKTAEKDLNRYKNLYEAGAVSAQMYDNAKTRYDSAKAKLSSAEQDILSDADDKVADANLRILKAQKDQAELNLGYTKITAPNAGIVTDKNVDKGKFVQTGQPVITIISDNIWIEANFKENQIGKLHPGQKVDIKIDAYPHKIFKGEIESIQAASGAKTSLFPPENAVGSFVKIVQRIPVKIIFTEQPDTEKYNISAGMSTVPKVHLKSTNK